MAIGEYLRIASTHLSRASAQRKQEASAKRGEISQREQFARREIENIRNKMRSNQAIQASGRVDMSQRTELIRQNQELQKQISRIEQRLRDERSQLIGVSEAMAQEAQSLQSQANNLSNRAATA